MHTNSERGFSLLIVLMALLIMSVAGAAAISVGGADATASAGRFSRAAALSAAESGLQAYLRGAAIETISDQRVPVGGGLFGAPATAPTIIADIVSTSDGTTYRSDFLVWGAGQSWRPDTANVIAQGCVRDPNSGSVMGTVWLGALLYKCTPGDAYGPQAGSNAQGSGVSENGSTSCDYRGGKRGGLGAGVGG